MESSENDLKRICKGGKLEKGLAIRESTVNSAKEKVENWIL